jgi:murein DD-endopeptidase MepM/ murein hydrolase activator NlpD
MADRFSELRKRLEEIRAIRQRLQSTPLTQQEPLREASAPSTPVATAQSTVSRIEELQRRLREAIERRRQRTTQRSTAITTQPTFLVAPPLGVSASLQQQATQPASQEPTAPTLLDYAAQYGPAIYKSNMDFFNAPREGGRLHKGLDVHLPDGAPIGAIKEGVIHHYGFDKDLGYYVRIKHPDGTFTTYGHLKSFPEGWVQNNVPVKIGAPVRRGALIGYVGTTGNAQGLDPHVHFIVRRAGKNGEPSEYLDPSSVFAELSPQTLMAMVTQR